MMDDPFLAFQLAQSVKALNTKPGQVSINNVQQIAEGLGFETFKEKIDGKERLTIAGTILLVDIDFGVKLVKDSEGDIQLDSKKNKQIVVENVSVTLASEQKTKGLFDEAIASSDDDGKTHLSLIYHLKKLLGFTNEDTPSPPGAVLMNGLKSDESVSTNVIEYDVVTLESFAENLKYLAILDSLSVYEPGKVVLKNEKLLSSPKELSDDVENSVLFDYINELSLLLNVYTACETKIELSKISSDASNTTRDKVFDILNGYRALGSIITNRDAKDVGLFLKYWEDSRFLNYRIGFKKIKSIEDIFDIFEMRKTTNYKSLKIGVDYHFENSLLQLHDVVRSESFNSILDAASQVKADFTHSNTVGNINMLSSLKVPHSVLGTFTHPDSKAVLKFEFSHPLWIPPHIFGEIFENFVGYNEYFGSNIHEATEFRSKKRHNVNEIYIKNYTDLFLNEIDEQQKSKKHVSLDFMLSHILLNTVYKTTFPNRGTSNVEVHIRSKFLSQLKRISDFNIYANPIEKTDFSIVDPKIEISKLSGIKAITPSGPFISSKAVFFKIDPPTGRSFMSTVCGYKSQETGVQYDFLRPLENFVKELRSIHVLWNLIDSLAKHCEVRSSKILKPSLESYLNSKVEDSHWIDISVYSYGLEIQGNSISMNITVDNGMITVKRDGAVDEKLSRVLTLTEDLYLVLDYDGERK